MTVKLSRNPNYLIHITSDSLHLQGGISQAVDIIANLPEQFGMSVASNWENRLTSSVGGVLQNVSRALGGTAEYLQSQFNVDAGIQSLTKMRWTGTGPIEFSLPLLFDAQDSAYDVMSSVRILQALCLPYASSFNNKITGKTDQILYPPGNTSISGKGKGQIGLRIGRMAYFDDVIIISVNDTIHSRLYVDGYPISADCEVTFRTTITPTRDDLFRWMGSPSTINTVY